jgi:hypothetical protein
MTAQEMQEEFLILYDKITSLGAGGYEPDEISRLLTKAQERFLFSRLHEKGNKYQEGFEETEKRRKDFMELHRNVVPTPSTNQVGVTNNGIFYDLPTDFYLAIREQVVVTSNDNCVNGNVIKVVPITHDEYNEDIQNPFAKPDVKDYIWRMDFSSDAGSQRHELITDGTFTVDEYRLRYIKKPQPIIVDTSVIDGFTGPLDCELNTMTHRAIIDEAVKIATSITEPELYQIKMNEQQSSE